MKKWIRRIPGLLLVMAVLSYLVIPAAAADLSGCRSAITKAARQEEKSVDLSRYALTCDELETLMRDMEVHNDLPWYVDNFQYTYSVLTNEVSELTFLYLDADTYDRDLYAQKLEQILEETVLPGMSQWQIALSIHDYLAGHFVYDSTLEHHEPYDLLINGSAVCEGYSKAYQDLLELAGLECIECLSENMNHSWNMVKLGSEWYHVDVTWDDPVPDIQGRVNHQYFLLDDATISDADHGHYSWEQYYTADDDSFTVNMPWIGISSPFCFESSTISYFRADEGFEHQIFRRDETTGVHTLLTGFDAGSVNIGPGQYHYSQYGLSLHNGRLYYCDMEHVYSVYTDGSGQTLEFSFDAAENRRYIGGAAVDGDTICLSLCDHSGDPVLKTCPLAASDADDHVHQYEARTIAPGCVTEGCTQYTCSCGESYRDEFTLPVGHSYDGGTPQGDVMVFTCQACGSTHSESLTSESGPELSEPVESDSRRALPLRYALLGLWAWAVALWEKNTQSPPRKSSRRASPDQDWF